MEIDAFHTDDQPMTAPMRPSTSEYVDVRGLRVHVRRWRAAGAPRLFLFHGTMDTSATFQFVVDAFAREWDVVAPDWPGHGLSDWRNGDYFHASYVADMAVLVDHYSPGEPIRLVAHSMGGIVAAMFCGACPERVRSFVNLEGIGPTPPNSPEAEVQHLRTWLGGLRSTRPHAERPSIARFAEELSRRNPRLLPARAEFLATQGSRPGVAGGVIPSADPRRALVTGPPRFPADVTLQALKQYGGPLLLITGGDSAFINAFSRTASGRAQYQAYVGVLPHMRHVEIGEAGHNVHHDQPARVAALVEEFMP